jgi:hypothetical protein
MNKSITRQIVFAEIALVYPSVFSQNFNPTVDYVNNPPLSDYVLRILGNGAIPWVSKEDYWHTVNNDAATAVDGIIIPLPLVVP